VDAYNVTVSLSSDSGSQTFTLTENWNHEVTVTLATLESSVASELGFEITLSKPSSGVYSVPAAGPTPLTGGGASTNASAILFTGQ
jgi:hypothetical protein